MKEPWLRSAEEMDADRKILILGQDENGRIADCPGIISREQLVTLWAIVVKALTGKEYD